MRAALRIAGTIDRSSEAVAAVACWSLLANAVLIAGNAVARKMFSVAIPTLFDLQWHFLAAVVMLMAAFALKVDEHVRIDVFARSLGSRAVTLVDLVGMTVVILPVCLGMIWISFPQFIDSLMSAESRASRESLSILPAWIIKGLIPAGFALLALQAIAEAIRCVARLRGEEPYPVHRARFVEEGLDVR